MLAKCYYELCLPFVIAYYFIVGLLGMVPPGTMLPNQMQPVMIAVPPKPEDTIAVHM